MKSKHAKLCNERRKTRKIGGSHLLDKGATQLEIIKGIDRRRIIKAIPLLSTVLKCESNVKTPKNVNARLKNARMNKCKTFIFVR